MCHPVTNADGCTGITMDFAAIDLLWAPLAERFDHRCLNDVLDNPTSELLARFIALNLGLMPSLELAVTVSESDSSSATYGGAPWPKPTVIFPK